MSVSIAMTTYNSERFVREQLESFVRQERQPDELVVSDDASTDRTVDILHEFALKSPFPVRVYVNDRNLGVAKNFENAIDKTTGTLIFLSDADDYWYPQKLLIMEQILNEEPQAGFAVCNSDFVNERLDPLGITTWEAKGRFLPSSRLRNKLVRGGTYRRRVPAGACCMALRAGLKPLILPLPGGEKSRRTSHDQFIAQVILCSGVAGAALIPKPLLAYRRHSGQVTHEKPTPFMERVIARLASGHEPPHLLPMLIERLESEWTAQNCKNPEIRASALRHWRARLAMPPSIARRLPAVAKELLTLRYHRFSGGALTAAKDLLFSRRPSAVS